MSDGLLFYASGGGWRKATLVAGEMTLIVPIGCCEPILASSETHRTFDLKPPRYAGGLEVVGYAMDRPALWPGSTALLQLDWRATSAPTADYTVFTHFVDSMWRIWGQKDQPLRNRQRPTGQWSPGEVASDYYLIPIGPDVPPGRLYFITVGIYAWPSVQAEKVINQGESMPAGADRLLLGPFEVARAAKESAKDAEHK
jgi:hypothetical protein